MNVSSLSEIDDINLWNYNICSCAISELILGSFVEATIFHNESNIRDIQYKKHIIHMNL